ncbi:MAG: EamA family transporter RarD [Verrucomicrobiota bacterium]|nr:EamA family transporter RarD [Verrucomicrobiota bacterium]
MRPTRDSHETSAFIAGVAAFVTWGLVPVYWKLLRFLPAGEILAHRFLWTCVFMILLLSWQKRWPEVLGNLRNRRTALFCAGSGIAIAINWFVFIWAVNAGHVLETSLGYFMTPLVNVLFGALLLRERLSRAQIISVVLATAAVLYLTFGFGRLPWVALTLCFSFGFYGFLRKVSGAAPVTGLFIETTVIVPLALGWLVYLAWRHGLHFGISAPGLSLLLVSTGIVTGLPLLWFAHAARHLRLTTLGFLQYLAPSCTFFLGIFVYHESFRREQMLTFALIWIALAIFTADAVTRWRSAKTSGVRLAR